MGKTDKLLRRLEIGDVHVVVVPQDTPTCKDSYGALVMETYVGKASIPEAVDARTRFARYGHGVICKLVPLTRDEIREAIKKT